MTGMALNLAKRIGLAVLLGGVTYFGLVVAANYGFSVSFPRTHCVAGFPNPHPHVVRNGEDAIGTFYTNWLAASNDPVNRQMIVEQRDWLRYEARQEQDKWHLIPHSHGTNEGGGTHVWIDGKSGCIVSEAAIDAKPDRH